MAKNIVFILMVLGSLLGGHVEAAGVFSEAGSYLEQGERFYKVDVFLDTEGQSLNVLEGEVNYSENDLNLEKIENGSSIINFWAKEPEKAGGGRITFSGGMPGGYKGEKGFLFAAIFSAKKELPVDRTGISFQNFKAYLNDGQGTEEEMTAAEKVLELEKIEITDVPAEDAKAPQVFAPYVTQDPGLEGGKWVVLFNAQDKGGGINYYEVFESEEKQNPEKIITSSGEGWVKAESGEAYVLRDQELESYIYVRAVDRSGNARVATVVPSDGPETERFDYKWLSAIMILSVIGSVAILEVFVFRRKR